MAQQRWQHQPTESLLRDPNWAMLGTLQARCIRSAVQHMHPRQPQAASELRSRSRVAVLVETVCKHKEAEYIVPPRGIPLMHFWLIIIFFVVVLASYLVGPC